MDISQLQNQISEYSTSSQASMPPVEKWNPAFCGNMDLVIKRSGEWWHEGTPFTRAKLIKLLASVLKKEQGEYFLVTPVEKIGIKVEDVPFVIIDSDKTDQGIRVITQTGDALIVCKEHPIELRAFENTHIPYCRVRRNLWARVHQNVLYRWINEALEEHIEGQLALFLLSADYKFCIGKMQYSG